MIHKVLLLKIKYCLSKELHRYKNEVFQYIIYLRITTEFKSYRYTIVLG